MSEVLRCSSHVLQTTKQQQMHQSNHINTTAVQDSNDTTGICKNTKTAGKLSIYQRKNRKKQIKIEKNSPQLTFICLERSAARKKACRLSNRKSTCCWATRIIKRKRSETLACVTLSTLCMTHCVRAGRQVCIHIHKPTL